MTGFTSYMYGQAAARAIRAFAALAVLAMVSCARTGVVEDHELDTVGINPMSFTNAGVVQQAQPVTKSSTSLSSGFMETTWKYYGTSGSVKVMDRYEVQYFTSGTAWDGNVRPYWDYTKVTGQYEHYWDLSGFPYRFHAVSPYPSDPAKVSIDGALKITAAYKSQTCAEGTVSPSAAEPYLVAQVQRAADGKDTDVFAGTEIESSNVSLTRSVSMPFHHLNSKVRFAIYATAPWISANHLYIKNLSIQTASSNFVTAAAGYEAAGSAGTGSWFMGSGNSGFTGVTKSASNITLLSLAGGQGVEEYDLMERQTQKTAYWLKCQDGLAQIPQEGVQMTVSMELVLADGTVKKNFTNVPVKLADNTETYNWQSGYINTYYLIINDIGEKLDIEFIATLTPWEDISGSLSTDLEK